jgi:hypothetical protein
VSSHRFRKIALVGAIALVAALAASASAGGGKTSTCNPGCEARVIFKPRTNGKKGKETLVIRDRAADGHSAVGYFQVFDRRLDEWVGLNDAVYFNSRGAGERPRRVHIQLGNGRRVRYQACVGDRDQDVFFDCGPYRRDRS